MSCQARTWSWILRGRLRPVDSRVVLAEVPRPGGALLGLRIAGISGREALEDLWQERDQAWVSFGPICSIVQSSSSIGTVV